MKNLETKSKRSSKTQGAGQSVDDAELTMMSDSLRGVIDPNDVYGDSHLVAGDVPPVKTGRPVRPMGFTCGVTLDDEQERSCDVLSFQNTHGSGTDGAPGEVRSVTLAMGFRDADDICTRQLTRMVLRTPSGVEFFDVEFDPNDPHDHVDMAYADNGSSAIVTLTFFVRA